MNEQTEAQQINCLRCRHAQLLPETNTSKASTRIFCAKKSEPSLLILSGCGLANPELHHYYYRKDGDKTRNVGELELEYLRAHYADGDMDTMCRHTGRKADTLRENARRIGLTRSRIGTTRTLKKRVAGIQRGRAAAGVVFTPEQGAFILDCQRRGFWPARGARGNSRRKSLSVKKRIVEGVNARANNGKVWTWKAILFYSIRHAPSRNRQEVLRCE